MAKQIILGDEARQQLLRGVNILSNLVKSTLGPRGKNVVIDKKFGSPTSTKDGVTVAKEVELKDHMENMGAQLVKEVASKTSDIAGDGTTTATVLAQAIYGQGLRYVTAGDNPTMIKKGIDKAVEEIVKELKKLSRDVSGEMIAQVGAISANNDESIGKIIAEAMDKVGKDGVITVEEGQSLGLEKEYTEGMQFDRGYISAYFVTNADRMEAVLDNPLIPAGRVRDSDVANECIDIRLDAPSAQRIGGNGLVYGVIGIKRPGKDEIDRFFINSEGRSPRPADAYRFVYFAFGFPERPH